MSKARDLSKLGSGFEIDGSNSRIDSDFVLQVFKKFIVKRDNASYLSGADSEIFSVNANQSPSTTTVRGNMDIRGDMIFRSYQKDSDRERQFNDIDTYTIRTGKHFDSDFANMVVDTLIGHGKEGFDYTSDQYNPITARLQHEFAISHFHDVNHDKAPVTGQYFRWSGDKWEPQDPDPEGNFTVDFQSATVALSAVTDSDTILGFSKEISNANALVFLNGHILGIDSDAFGDGRSAGGTGTDNQDSDSDKYALIDYRILANVTTEDVDQIVSGPADALQLYGGANHQDEVTVISPIDETIAHFYKNFRFADSDFAVYRTARNHWDGSKWVDSEGPSSGKIHQTFRMIDSDIYTDSEMIAARVGGDPLIFLNGMNINQRHGDFYFYDSDSDQKTVYKAGRMIAFDSDQYLLDSDELVAVWIRNVGPIASENFQTLEHTFTVVDSDHPGFTSGVVSVPFLTNSNDPLHALVFLNGHLLANAPVLTYQVRASTSEILFTETLNIGDQVSIYNFSGPTTSNTSLGNLSNVDRGVDNQFEVKTGEALIFSGTEWTHQFKNTISETPVTAAWMRVTFDSDNGPNPNKIIDRATYGFDSDQLKYSRHQEGVYYFLLDSEVVPVTETQGFYMSMAVSTCAPQGQPIFASIDAQGQDARAPGPGADSETGLTIDVFGGKPLIANPNNRAIRVRTWDQNGNTIDPIQINVQVWFKRSIG
jgi:hypothetical protein